jgi:epoxyqueuosine reductase
VTGTGLTAERVRAEAYALGFDPVGVTTLGPMGTAGHYDRWLEAGYAGEMQYLHRGRERRGDSRRAVPGTTSGVVVALDCGGAQPAGPVARYSRGRDYHDVMTLRLGTLHERITSAAGRPVAGKAYVDTGPLLERELAQRAGLGWFGKNTMLINPRRGSHLMLGVLVLDLSLEPDAPFEADRCGTCRRCLDACPTGAFVAPRVLDARRCISYLTIELRGSVPIELRAAVGERLFGCDVCQDVCPWNQRFARGPDEALAPGGNLDARDARTLAREVLPMTASEFAERFRGSPLKRAKLAGLKRNAAVVLGNIGDRRDVELLEHALGDEAPPVRGHAAWALGRMGADEAASALAGRLASECDDNVSREITRALLALASRGALAEG